MSSVMMFVIVNKFYRILFVLLQVPLYSITARLKVA